MDLNPENPNSNPKQQISVHAIDGGKTGWGTIQAPEYGVGDDELVHEDTEVRWDDTHHALRDPYMKMVGNEGDRKARLWFTERRPGTLRGQHLITEDGCECDRIICKYACEPECKIKGHKGRHKDPKRAGVCPILAKENAFELWDDNFSRLHKDLLVDEMTKKQAELDLGPKYMLKWEAILVERYKRAKAVQDR